MDYLKKIFHFCFKNIDYQLLFLVVTISLIGVVYSYSSQILIREEKINLYIKFVKQVIYFCFGLGLMLACSYLNYKKIAEHSLIFMFIGIGVLLYTLFEGVTVNNSKRWINLGFVGLQPSEFIKLIVIVFTANYLTKLREDPKNKRYWLLVIGMNFIPIALILLQPDLGTASIIFFIVFIMFSFSVIPTRFIVIVVYLTLTISAVLFSFIYFDVNKSERVIIKLFFYDKYLILLALLLLFIGSILYIVNFIFWRNLKVYFLSILFALTFLGALTGFFIDEFFLKAYQKERLIVFLDPENFRWSLGYNIIQSVITIGSGGAFGKGLFNGAQSQLGFLPSRSTDFIFSVISEELGFVGSLTVVVLFFLLIWRMLFLASKVKDYLGGLIIIGVILFLSTQSIINLGMTMSLLPVTGLPLPFISAGGSTLLSALIATGMVFSVFARRNVN